MTSFAVQNGLPQLYTKLQGSAISGGQCCLTVRLSLNELFSKVNLCCRHRCRWWSYRQARVEGRPSLLQVQGEA